MTYACQKYIETLTPKCQREICFVFFRVVVLTPDIMTYRLQQLWHGPWTVHKQLIFDKMSECLVAVIMDYWAEFNWLSVRS